MKGKRKVSFLAIAGLALVMAAVIIAVNSRSFFQEGNPLPVFAGIWRLEVDKAPYAQIKADPPTYIARAGMHGDLFSFVEKTYGVTYSGTEGALYVFTGAGKTVELATRNYTRSFRIWEVVRGNPP